MRNFKLLAICIVVMTLFSSCVSERLYYWGSMASGDVYEYDEAAYAYYDKQSPQAICDLIMVYEDMVNNPGGSRQVPPPGVCAEYGYLLLTPDIDQIFASTATPRQRKMMSRTDFYQYGLELMQKEIELYPESAQFIKPLVDRAKERKP